MNKQFKNYICKCKKKKIAWGGIKLVLNRKVWGGLGWCRDLGFWKGIVWGKESWEGRQTDLASSSSWPPSGAVGTRLSSFWNQDQKGLGTLRLTQGGRFQRVSHSSWVSEFTSLGFVAFIFFVLMHPQYKHTLTITFSRCAQTVLKFGCI
jgi:hypothetical protein